MKRGVGLSAAVALLCCGQAGSAQQSKSTRSTHSSSSSANSRKPAHTPPHTPPHTPSLPRLPLKLNLRQTAQSSFDYTPAARCKNGWPTSDKTDEPPILRGMTPNAAACEARCAANAECAAAEYTAATRTCAHFRSCMERIRAVGTEVFHRWGPVWPPKTTPNDVVWTTNASLVIVSYHASLAWLRSLPGGLVDIVIYHKKDTGGEGIRSRVMTPDYVRQHLAKQEICGGGRRRPYGGVLLRGAVVEPGEIMSRPMRVHFPTQLPGAPCPENCTCGTRAPSSQPRLAYFAALPNYGSTTGLPYGGSREVYGYLQYVIDFWQNMPPVVIFSQDDCLARGCAWGNHLARLRFMLEHWPAVWPGSAPPTATNCLCKRIREDTYRPKKYFWYRFMAFMQEHLFNVSLAARGTIVVWPQDATFAVARGAIRSQPHWLYEAVLRLSTMEKACYGGTGSIMWAHAMERLWFEFFDSDTPKILRRGTPTSWSGRVPPGSCLLDGAVPDPRSR